MNRRTKEMVYHVVVLFAFLAFAGQASANQFFQECSEAIDKPEFSALKKYLNSRQDLPHPDKCFRINNYQFLVTVTDTGRVAQGLYYYDAKANTYGLDGGGYMPNIDVVQEFMGPNNKRYALLYASNLSRGGWWQGYSILNLIPTKDGKSYVHYSLLSWSEDPESGLCGHWISTDRVTGKTELHKKISSGTASSIEKPQIVNEGMASIQMIFPVTEQNCETSERKTYNRTFVLSDGVFKEVKN